MASRNTLKFKNEAKRGIKYTIMVTGPSGTGKSTFINSLLETELVPHKYQPIGSSTEQPEVLSFSGDSNFIHDSRDFNPLRQYEEPTIAITSSKLEITDEDGSRILLTVIDTPGFGENLDNEICFTEIISFLEQQFDQVLSEETRIRRNPRFEDARVHICLYFIEATGHGLRELDVEAMKKLSKYVNVLPIISKADSFTQSELLTFKKNILLDINKYNVPVFEFNYDDEEEEDYEIIEENKQLRSLQPFSVISSTQKFQIDGELKLARQYPWGLVDIEANSDFFKLKNVLFGTHLQDFKDLTTNYLYENYRTERLSSVTDSEKKLNPVNPSLSNLAALTLNKPESDNIKSEYTVDPGLNHTPVSTPTSKPTGTFKSELESSPIKQLARQIKDDNESIISSIKNSPKLEYSPDPSRNKLRAISETVPYVIKHEHILSRQQKLQELEEKSARELALRAAALEKKAAELKRRERLLKGESQISNLKKEETLTDLSSIVNND